MIELCAIVISHDRLHTLLDTHDNHHKEEYKPIGHTESGNLHISTIAQELVIEYNHHKACSHMHEERSCAYA